VLAGCAPKKLHHATLHEKLWFITKATQPRSGQQHQITIQNPLIRPAGTFSPMSGEKGKMKGSYLEEHFKCVESRSTGVELP